MLFVWIFETGPKMFLFKKKSQKCNSKNQKKQAKNNKKLQKSIELIQYWPTTPGHVDHCGL